ncbi:hypothetical protein [Paraburkholderia sediminicola]|uniref:hypothetical protein n=1 Tax=Paraburkholderia sediminicola TaxID=458836 RepID=UPI0038BA0090
MGLLDFTSTGDGDPAGGLMGMYANPQTAGLMGMAQGLLAASGPSRIPVTMGQAMGAGVGGLQQGAMQGIDMQRQLAQYGLMRQLMTPPQGGVPTPSSSAPVTGDTNVAGLSGPSAGLGSYAPEQTPVAQAAQAQGPLIGGYTPQELLRRGQIMSVLGMPAGSAWMELGAKYDPSLSYAMPTDVQKDAAAAYGYGTPGYYNALGAYEKKQGYIAPVAGRPGGSLTGPDGVTRYNLPAPQAGAMWATNPDGSLIYNQAGQPYQIGIGGAIDAARGMSAAQASGPAQFKIVPGMQNGTPVNTTAYNIANGLPPPGQGGASNGAPAQGGAFSGYQAPNGAPVAPSLPPGANTLAEGSAKSFNDLRAQAGSTPTAIDGYNRAEQTLLDGVTTGPGSTLGTNIIGRLNTAGIPLLKGDATGFQSLQKYLSNANAQAAAASGYNGSDARFESFSHGQPNTENMNPQALRYAIQYVRGQQFGVQAKYQAAQSFLNQQGGNTVNYPQFEAQWNKVYSPDVALVKAMPNPADQQAYLAQLKQQGKLGAWMKSYQQMQQMGGF